MKETIPSSDCCVLIKGPSGVGKLEFCVDLAKGFLESGEPVIFVAVDSPTEQVRAIFRRFGLDPARYEGKTLVFMDCFSANLGETPKVDPARKTVFVTSLSNLEQIAMSLQKVVSWFDSSPKVIFHSLSPLFFHNSSQALAKFFQILSAQIRNESGLAVYTLHEGVHEESTVRTMEMFVNGVIEMRFDQNLRREMRVHHMQGMSVSPRWMAFQVDDAFILDADARLLTKRFSDSEGETPGDLEKELYVAPVRPRGRPNPS